MDYLEKINKFILGIIILLLAVVVLGTINYPGNKLCYILFSFCFLGLFGLGFTKRSFFFDTFLGGMMLLGFWSKLSFFLISGFQHTGEAVGFFNFSGQHFDNALMVASIGALGFISARLIRPYLMNYSQLKLQKNYGEIVTRFYSKYKKEILICFTVFYLLIGISNLLLGIYQRGMASQTVLPLKLNSVYTWLLLFGLTSFSCTILLQEFKIYKTITKSVVIVIILELFSSTLSILSRGMILLFGALLLGGWMLTTKLNIKLTLKKISFISFVFISFFFLSLTLTQYLRLKVFYNPTVITSSRAEGVWKTLNSNLKVYKGTSSYVENMIQGLFINRWVGLEGVMSVSAYPKTSWELFKESLSEKRVLNGTSFYDRVVTSSHYSTAVKAQNTSHITLPGLIGYLYYTGSYVFLFVATFLLGLLGATIDWLSYYLSNSNPFFASLMGFIVASRYIHFGFAPQRSYLLFGAILMNIFLIYLISGKSKTGNSLLNKLVEKAPLE
ncbi:MAG: hypothetical protein HN576_04455 [Bacteriovoracaceae bacterium]|jgi:hypothetical protein|nr:hypothetical protein [Bacteriovoracaceae bacterium]